MLLTILEMWIASDKSATHIHGIIGDYDACIPMETFQSFLLSLRSQMERLARAEICAKDIIAYQVLWTRYFSRFWYSILLLSPILRPVWHT